jgi:hypothetical protein
MTTKVRSSVLADTTVTPETYGGVNTLQAFTVDAQGRITYAANITSGVITAGTRGQAADIIVPTIQYNALGQIVAATNNTIRTANTTVTGVVQLADSVSNTSTTAAATASAVKAAFDAAASNASTALSSSQANTGAVNIALSNESSSRQANVGALNIALSNESSSRQANVGAVAISSKNADNLSSGTVASARISGSYTGITGVGTLTVGSIPYATSAGSASSATNATYATTAGSATYASSAGAVAFNNLTGTPALLYLKAQQSQVHPINSAAGNVSDAMDILVDGLGVGHPAVTIDFDYWTGWGTPTGGFYIVSQGIYRWKVWTGSNYVRVTIGNSYGIGPHIWTTKLWF